MLPFTPEIYFSLFEQYNRAIWPAPIIAYVLGLAVVLLILRPVAGSDRIIGALLAAAWAWIGLIYHLQHFNTINFLAPAFGSFFAVQGLLFAWTLVVRAEAAFRFAPDLIGLTGAGLVIFAMLVYPLLAWLAGHGWPQAATFGLSPAPTTIFTLGLLLLSRPRPPLHLVIIPVLWSLIGGAIAWLLDIREDFALPLAGIGTLCLILFFRDRSGFPRAGPTG